MLPQYLISLTKHNINPTTPSLQNRAYANMPLQSLMKSSSGCTSAHVASRGSVDVGNSQRAAVTDSATPPGIAQGRLLLHPRMTTRVPDYDKMRTICPDDWLKELRNPSLVLAVPSRFAMPLPTRPKEVNRDSISTIVDQHWEYRAGEVQLVDTTQITAIEDHSIDRDGLAPRSEDVLADMVRYTLDSQGHLSGPKNTYWSERSPPLPPSPSHIQWRSRTSPTRDASSSEASPTIETPVTTAISQGDGCPARHCDWIDCRYCPMLAENERTGVSNWQSALAIRSTQSYTSRRGSCKAKNQCTMTQTPSCGKKNSRGTTSTRKTAGGASGAAEEWSANGERSMDAEEEYWQVAAMLGLVRRA